MGATVLGTKAYFAGGDNGTNVTSTVQIYDMASGQWDDPQNLSVPRDLPFAVTCGSKIFFAGGADFYGTGEVFSTVDIYDTLTGQWTQKQLSVPRLNAAVVSHGNKVLFAGGANINEEKVYDVVDIYDVETGEWDTASLSEARSPWWAKVGDKAIIAGGFMFGSVSKRVDIYNFTTGTWSIDSLSVARGFVGMATIGNKVLIAGGVTNENQSSNIVDIYDATTGTWTTDTLSKARAFCDNQNVVAAGGKVYFVGGGDIDLIDWYWYNAYTVIDIYDPSTGTWSVDQMPFSARIHHAVVSFGDGFMIAGGINSIGYQSLSAIYTCELVGVPEVGGPAKAGSPLRFDQRSAVSGDVKLTLHDITGKQIRILVDEVQAPGEHSVHFDASGLPAGIYLVRLQAGEEVVTEKMVVLR
jgi:N-acetylneuraminic acid mutarotase